MSTRTASYTPPIYTSPFTASVTGYPSDLSWYAIHNLVAGCSKMTPADTTLAQLEKSSSLAAANAFNDEMIILNEAEEKGRYMSWLAENHKQDPLYREYWSIDDKDDATALTFIRFNHGLGDWGGHFDGKDIWDGVDPRLKNEICTLKYAESLHAYNTAMSESQKTSTFDLIRSAAVAAGIFGLGYGAKWTMDSLGSG